MRDPKEPQPSRLRRSLQFALASALTGLSLVAVIYLSGLLSLVGDYRQELYILPGIILGGLLFGLLGAWFAQRVSHAVLLSAIVALVEVLGLTWLDLAYPVVTDADLFLRSLATTVAALPIGAAVLPRVALRLHERRSLLWGAGLGLGPLVMGLSYSYLYAEVLGFEDFAFLVLGTELVALPTLVLYFLLTWRRDRRSVGGDQAGPPDTASTNPPENLRPPSEGSRSEEPARAPVLPSRLPLRSIAGARRRPVSLSISTVLSIALVALLLVSSLPVARGRSSPAPGRLFAEASTTRTPIQHVIMIMMENHAFDNLFGTYPLSPSTGAPVTGLPIPANLLSLGFPRPVSEVPNGTWDTVDPIEGYSPYHIDWDGGKMDGFLAGSGPQSLTYFTADQLGAEWDWAEEYALNDNYFASALTETTPNRLWTLAGYSPVMNDYGPPPYVPLDQTIFGELDAYGVPWAYYLSNPSEGLGTLDFIQGLSTSTSSIQTWSDFSTAVRTGTLPPVSWLQPVDGGLGDQYSQGPPGNVIDGEMWLLYFIDEVMESPIWNSTAILITYDEGGGYFDQVAPPVLDGEQLGQRVPFLLISPYAKEAYVSHTEMNHDSQIAFVEYNWGLPALNSFVSQSDIPLDMFDFADGPRAPLPFTAAQGFPTPSSAPPAPTPYTVPSGLDLSSLFPMPLQVPESDLSYDPTGSVQVDLASISSSVFATQDVPFTPWFITEAFLGTLLLVELALWLGPDLLRPRPFRPNQDQVPRL